VVSGLKKVSITYPN